MRLPTIHLNGTSRESLLDGYQKALTAVEGAIDALCAAAPNGRDYYPQGDDSISGAIEEHRQRLQHLITVRDDLTTILLSLMVDNMIKTYRVTIKVEDGRRETVVVQALDEWKARTRAMAVTTLRLSGEFVDYDVVEEN